MPLLLLLKAGPRAAAQAPPPPLLPFTGGRRWRATSRVSTVCSRCVRSLKGQRQLWHKSVPSQLCLPEDLWLFLYRTGPVLGCGSHKQKAVEEWGTRGAPAPRWPSAKVGHRRARTGPPRAYSAQLLINTRACRPSPASCGMPKRRGMSRRLQAR